jgi:hypothetical protein
MKTTIAIEFDWDKYEQQIQVEAKSTKVTKKEPVFYALMLASDEWRYLIQMSQNFDELRHLCNMHQMDEKTAPYDEYYIVRQFKGKLETVYSGQGGYQFGADFDVEE